MLKHTATSNNNSTSQQTLSLDELARLLMVLGPKAAEYYYSYQLNDHWVEWVKNNSKIQQYLFELIEASKTITIERLFFEISHVKCEISYNIGENIHNCVSKTWELPNEFRFFNNGGAKLGISFFPKIQETPLSIMVSVAKGLQTYEYFLKLCNKLNNEPNTYSISLIEMLSYRLYDQYNYNYSESFSATYKKAQEEARQVAIIVCAYINTKYPHMQRSAKKEFQLNVLGDSEFRGNFNSENNDLYGQACAYYKKELAKESKDKTVLMLPEIDIAKVAANAITILCKAKVLKEKNFRNACIPGAYLNYTDFQYSDFTGANLSHANLECSDFTGANLSGAYFDYSYMWNVNFSNAKLYNCNFFWLQNPTFSKHCEGLNIEGAEGLSAETVSLLKKHGAIGTPKPFFLSKEQTEQEREWQEKYSKNQLESKIIERKPLNDKLDEKKIKQTTSQDKEFDITDEETKNIATHELVIEKSNLPEPSAPAMELLNVSPSRSHGSLFAASANELVVPSIVIAPVPEHFYCPINQTIMSDPVMTLLGKTYERKYIADWLKDHDTDPLTNDKLPGKMLIPNDLVRGMILEWKEQNPDHPEVIATNNKKKEYQY